MKKKPKIIELDFGMGNIRSLQKAFEHLGQPVEVVSDYKKVKNSDVILLPGDGAFKRAIKELQSLSLIDEIKNHHLKKKPILGICIGFQILFSGSEEFGDTNGLSLLMGTFKKIKTELKLPHIGWSRTQIIKDSKLMKNIQNGSYFYYVHSYALAQMIPETTASCTYGEKFTVIIEKDHLFGVQFHPEKSQKTGLQLLQNFLNTI